MNTKITINGNKMNDKFNGDEFDIEAEARQCAEEYEAEHADDWKYEDGYLGYHYE